MVDVLATDDQQPALIRAIAAAVCGAPGDHDGPCRIAWSIASRAGADAEDDGALLTPHDVQEITEDLRKVPVWPIEDVDRSLGIAGR